MIVNRVHGFGYVHAAKCGGSTIRNQLRDLDDFSGRFHRMIEHEELGRINGNHIQLFVVEKYFPEALEMLRSVDSYMLTRDPLDRFISGVSQWLRSQHKRQPEEIESIELQFMLAHLMKEIRESLHPSRRDLVYFFPQITYSDLHNERIIKNIIPLNQIDQLFDIFENRYGITFVRDSVWNPSVTYRFKSLVGPLNKAKVAAQKHLSVSQYARLRDLALSLFTRRVAPAFKEAVISTPGLAAFVEDFYASDGALHTQALNDLMPQTQSGERV